MISKNTISGSKGDGISIDTTSSTVTIKSNTINKNLLYGIDITVDAKAFIRGNTIKKASKSPGKIRISGSSESACITGTSSVKITEIKKKGRKAIITWKELKGASSYQIYRKSTLDKEYVMIGTSKDTKFSNKKLRKGIVYKYKVIPVYKKTVVFPSGTKAKKVRISS